MVVVRDIVERPRKRIVAQEPRIAVVERVDQHAGRAEDSARRRQRDDFGVRFDVGLGRRLAPGEPLVIHRQRDAVGDAPRDDGREHGRALLARREKFKTVFERAVEPQQNFLVHKRLVEVERRAPETLRAGLRVPHGKRFRAGTLRDVVHRAAGRDLTVEHRRRAFDDLDALDTHRVHVAFTHEAVVLRRLVEAADGVNGVARVELAPRARHARRVLHHVEEIARADVGDELLRERADRKRQVLDRRVDARGRNGIARTVAFVGRGRDLKLGELQHFFACGSGSRLLGARREGGEGKCGAERAAREVGRMDHGGQGWAGGLPAGGFIGIDNY